MCIESIFGKSTFLLSDLEFPALNFVQNWRCMNPEIFVNFGNFNKFNKFFILIKIYKIITINKTIILKFNKII